MIKRKQVGVVFWLALSCRVSFWCTHAPEFVQNTTVKANYAFCWFSCKNGGYETSALHGIDWGYISFQTDALQWVYKYTGGAGSRWPAHCSLYNRTCIHASSPAHAGNYWQALHSTCVLLLSQPTLHESKPHRWAFILPHLVCNCMRKHTTYKYAALSTNMHLHWYAVPSTPMHSNTFGHMQANRLICNWLHE